MNIFSIAAGYVLNFLLNITHNYLFAIIAFTILVRLITVPIEKLGARASKKYTDLKPQIEKIKNSGMDVHGVEDALVKLYEENHISYKHVFAKPLSMLLSMVLFVGFIGAVFSPLTYVLRFSKETIAGFQSVLGNLSELQIVEAFRGANVVDFSDGAAVEKLTQFLENMTVFGVDLSRTPTVDYLLWLPILALALRILIIGLSALRMYVFARFDENITPKVIRRGIIFDFVMFALFCTLAFTLPASLCVYWITSSVINLIISIVGFITGVRRYKKQVAESV